MVPEWIRSFLSWGDSDTGDWLASHSLLAVQHPVGHQRRLFQPRGLMPHTTGRGVLRRAEEWGCSPIDAALRIYSSMETGPHYVGDYDGTLYQLLPDNRVAWHAGRPAQERRLYLSGQWTERVSSEARARWQERWPGYASPQHLFGTKSPNYWYDAVEFVPLPPEDVGEDGLWFTPQQHDALVALGGELADRYEWPSDWYEGPRLASHDDTDALHRWDDEGGWDLGAWRPEPRFDWERVLAGLRGG